jgi:hypothetical protein
MYITTIFHLHNKIKTESPKWRRRISRAYTPQTIKNTNKGSMIIIFKKSMNFKALSNQIQFRKSTKYKKKNNNKIHCQL